MTLFEGITAHTIETPRLSASLLTRDADESTDDERTVIFLHGALSSAPIWQETMLALPQALRVIAIDLRGYGRSADGAVDAARGVRDFSDDLHSVFEAIGLGAVHLVGWDLGAAVALQYAIDHPVRSVTVQSPIDPSGFGSGAEDADPAVVDALATGAGAADVFRERYVAANEPIRHQEVWTEAMLGAARAYPAVLDALTSEHLDLSGIVHLTEKPPLLWVHGDADEATPSEAVDAIRALLGAYREAGGAVAEYAVPGVGSIAHVEEPEEFRAALLQIIKYFPPSSPPTEAIILRSSD